MRHRIASSTLFVLVLLFTGVGASADTLLIAPGETLQPGSTATVEVLFTNEGAAARDVRIPLELKYQLSGSSNTTDSGLLRLVDPARAGTHSLNAGAFVRVAYNLQVPSQWNGLGRLSLTLPNEKDATSPVALIEVAPQPVQFAQATPDGTGQELNEDLNVDLGVIETIETAVGDVYDPDDAAPFQSHEPMFFLYGLNPDEAKFQISFKYRLFHNIKDTSPLRFLQNMHVAYTQLSFWDFDSASKPFKDSSYKPEIFYDIGDPVDPTSPIIPGIGLRHVRLGIMHESNGQEGLASRSLNYAYVQPEFVFDFGREDSTCRDCEWWELSVQPRTWLYAGSTSDNPDIDDFRGHAEVRVRVMERNVRNQTGIGLAATLRKGDAHDKATLTVDATTPFPFVQGLFTPNLHAQFFTGYSESLIGFDQKDTRFRVGFGTRW